jgi:hypothetical protein
MLILVKLFATLVAHLCLDAQTVQLLSSVLTALLASSMSTEHVNAPTVILFQVLAQILLAASPWYHIQVCINARNVIPP